MVGVGGGGGEGWWWGGVGLPPIQPFRIRDDLSSYDRVGGGEGVPYTLVVYSTYKARKCTIAQGASLHLLLLQIRQAPRFW